MQNKLLDIVDKRQLRTDEMDFNVGNNVRVHVRIREGNKERIQIFEGIVIRIKGARSSKTFTVRKISYGIGVERTFFVNSPLIASVTVVRENKVRRAKLYYMRELKGKSARLKEIVKAKKPPVTKAGSEAKD